nr:histidinol-phosphate transaminase [bacterium]
MSQYWSRIAARIEPYVPGEQPKDKRYIKLNTNENPYPPSPRALAAIREAADGDLRLYPDPDCVRLRQAFSRAMGVKEEEVFVGNGSDEVLAVAFQAFFDPGNPVLFPDLSYSFYPVYASLYGIDYHKVNLADDFTIRVEDYLVPNGGIIIPNPNAPTSIAMPASDICRLLEYNQKLGRVVVVDEAYIAFGGQSMVPYISKYDNLVVITTLSKSYALAGLRGGFALAQKPLVEALDRIKNSFNSYTLDRLAIAGASEAVLDQEYFKEITGKVRHTRDRIASSLRQAGFEVLPSASNFLFMRYPGKSGSEIFQKLREAGILVRYFATPRIADYIRVTIGTDEQMDIFYREITRIVGITN